MLVTIIEMLSNIDLLKERQLDFIIFSWLGLYNDLFVLLASLILRTRPTAAENRFMFLLLIGRF